MVEVVGLAGAWPRHSYRVMHTPTLSPSRKYTPERISVSVDRRFDVAGACPVPAKLAPGAEFAPTDVLLWVNLDLEGSGRWSANLWGDQDAPLNAREAAQFDGPVRDRELVVHTAPPEWVLAELADMLAQATGMAGSIR